MGYGIKCKSAPQVRCFSATWSGALEEAVNYWLTTRGPGFQLLDIKFNVTEIEGKALSSAMVIYNYTDLEAEDDEEEAEE